MSEKKCCYCGDIFSVGFQMANGDMVCADYSCCYQWCKDEGIRIYQDEEVDK